MKKSPKYHIPKRNMMWVAKWNKHKSELQMPEISSHITSKRATGSDSYQAWGVIAFVSQNQAERG